MKRRVCLSALSLIMLIAVLLSFSGCAKSFFNVTGEDDGTVSVTAQKAAVDSTGLGYLTVGEGQQIVIKPDLAGKSVLHVEIAPYSAPDDALNQTADEILSMLSPENPVVSEDIKGTDLYSFKVEPGEYVVVVTVVERSEGTVTIAAK